MTGVIVIAIGALLWAGLLYIVLGPYIADRQRTISIRIRGEVNNPLRVIGGHRGPDAPERHLGKTRLP